MTAMDHAVAAKRTTERTEEARMVYAGREGKERRGENEGEIGPG